MSDGAERGFIALVVDRPVAVIMLVLAAAVFGLVAFAQLPVDLMPDISYPTLTVRTEYPGAAPDEVESQISALVEEAVATVDGLAAIESRSRAEVSDVVLEFHWGTSMHRASQSVREMLQSLWLAEGAERPLILRYDPSLDPILRIALSGEGSSTAEASAEGSSAPDNSVAQLFALRELAAERLRTSLEGIQGVAAVGVRGGLKRIVLVELEEDLLSARGITLETVRASLSAENVNVAGGAIFEGGSEYLLRVLGELNTLSDLRALGIPRSDGFRVPLGELGRVVETHEERDLVARLNGNEAVELEIYKEADANIVQTARRVKRWLQAADLEAMGVDARLLEDQAAFIESSIGNLARTVLVGGFLAISILFLFLREFRASAIIATAIPLSVICAFAPLHLGGVSLNLMSLGGLALGVGMLVDNAVVVLEAISVHREKGTPRREAAIRGTQEVAAAVTASTLTTVAVFLPIHFVEGVAGQLFGDLALSVVFSLLASLVVALVLVPMLAARGEVSLEEVHDADPLAAFGSVGALKAAKKWIRAGNQVRGFLWIWVGVRFLLHLVLDLWRLLVLAPGLFLVVHGVRLLRRIRRPLAAVALRASAGFGDWFEARAERYPVSLQRTLAHRGPVLVGAVVLLALSLVGLGSMGRELIPQIHQGRFTVELAHPVGTPLARNLAQMDAMEARVLAQKGVEGVYSIVGAERRSDARGDEGPHTARLLVELAPSARIAAQEEAAKDGLRQAFSDLAGIEVNFRSPALFSFQTPVEVVIFGRDTAQLQELSDAALAALAGVEGLQDLQSSLQPGFPELRVRYDRLLLERLGLSAQDVAQSIRNRIQGVQATRISRGTRTDDLVVRLVEGDRSGVSDLESLNVNPKLQPPLPLSSVAHIERAEGPSEIRRVDQQRAVVISANLVGFDLGGVGQSIEDTLSRLSWPQGADFEVSGQSREMSRSLSSLGFALGLAVFLVYVIMASTFESLLHPFVILTSLPLALVGVVGLLLPLGSSLSVVVLIGLIVLAGVVVNNAIVLVDFVNRLRGEGRDLETAILEAGRARLRPIVITTSTTVLGLLPLGLGFGEGAEIQQPLALTLMGGLVSATLLTLWVVPTVYRTLGALERR